MSQYKNHFSQISLSFLSNEFEKLNIPLTQTQTPQSYIDDLQEMYIDILTNNNNSIIIDNNNDKSKLLMIWLFPILKPDFYISFIDYISINRFIKKVYSLAIIHLNQFHFILYQRLLCGYFSFFGGHSLTEAIQMQITIDMQIQHNTISTCNLTPNEKKYIRFVLKSLLFFLFSYHYSLTNPDTYVIFPQLLSIHDKYILKYISKQIKKALLFHGFYKNINKDNVTHFIYNALYNYNHTTLEHNNIINSMILYSDGGLFKNVFYLHIIQKHIITNNISNINTNNSFDNNLITKISSIINNIKVVLIKNELILSDIKIHEYVYGNYPQLKAQLCEIFISDYLSNLEVQLTIPINRLIKSIVIEQNNYEKDFTLLFLSILTFGKYNEFLSKYSQEQLNEFAYGGFNNDLTEQERMIGFIIRHFKEKIGITSLENINNVFITKFTNLDDLYDNIMLLLLLKSIFTAAELKQYLQLKIQLITYAKTINNKLLLEMCKEKDYNMTYLNLLLHCIDDLQLEYPIDNVNFFYDNSNINSAEYAYIYYKYQLFLIDYCILTHKHFSFLYDTMINNFNVLINTIFTFLFSQKKYEIIIQYISLYLQFFDNVLNCQKSNVRIVLPYCMFCLRKMSKVKCLIGKYMIFCVGCERGSLICRFDNCGYFDVKEREKYIKEIGSKLEMFVKKYYEPEGNDNKSGWIYAKIIYEVWKFVVKNKKVIGENILEYIDKVKEGFFNKIINEEMKGDDFYDVCREVKYVVKSLDCCFEDEMYIM